MRHKCGCISFEYLTAFSIRTQTWTLPYFFLFFQTLQSKKVYHCTDHCPVYHLARNEERGEFLTENSFAITPPERSEG